MASASYRGRMIVNDTDYTGSFVDPNPSGVATDNLNTVAIDGKIFNVVGSGGGSIYREVTLYNAPDRTWRDITLADSLLNYDLVLFHVHDTSYNGSDANHQHEGALVFTKQELIDCYNDTKVLWLMGYGDTWAQYTLTDYQTLTVQDHVTVFVQRITGVKFGSSQVSPVIYSTEEREVGVWKNNKPLYQKTCVFGSVSGQTASLSLGIANIEEAFLCADASYINDGVCPLPYVTGTAYANNIGGFFDIGVNDTSFAIRIGQSMAGNVSSVVLTVRYTKTTDVAGSGRYNTLGTPMQHYSTTEEVIGTWIDGRTLYRRVYDFTSSPITVPTNTWLKVANDWQIQPIRGTVIITSTRAAYDVAVDCDDNDGLYVRSWLSYGNVNYLIVEYVKDSN